MRSNLAKLAESWPTDIPFERAVRRKLPELRRIISDGLTWGSIAVALTEAGVRKRDGCLMPARQMNTVFLRVSRSAVGNDCQHDRPKPRATPRSPIAITARAPRAAPVPVIKRMTAASPTESQESSPVACSSPSLSQRLSEAQRLRIRKRNGFDD